MKLDSLTAAALALALAALAVPARAQLRLPSLPSLPRLPELTAPLRRDVPALGELTQLRQRRIGELLRERRDVVEADPNGEPVRRSELVLTAPSEALLAAALADGFAIARERVLDALELRLVTLRAPPGWDTRRALQRLREIDPQAAIDYNHVYLQSGETAAPSGVPNAVATVAPNGIKVGLIDGGVDSAHAVFRGTTIHRWGCTGQPVPSAHGTAVASLLVGRAGPFHGAAPAATLYAADVYCGDAAGASVDTVAGALAWMLGERVAVVNISLVGPANRALEQVVRRTSARGLLLVAAVGNDGPAAPPLYPAAYPEVVGVTGVDARSQVLPEAGRGPHVAFAAPGSDMAAAGVAGAAYTRARGTSFAAPLVAGLLAASLHEPDAAKATLAVAALARSAVDLGAAGRDAVYGHGLVGRTLRIEPSRVMADR
ncbi:S8 family serine peptidase [Piscinibacter sp.]|jgi:subtilisin family serine protease|uniref:S8 family serine peptidase n=1 Tax=Piscinibacter sp. TaxID=1903157 RepID=UPI002F418A6B